MAADLLGILTKLVLKNDTLVGVLAQGFAEHAALLLQTLERCGRCQRDAATVRHQTLGLRYCDRCAATIITKARRRVGGSGDLDLTLLLGHIMVEEAWVDLPNAIGIRRAQDLVTMSTYNDEPPVPERGSPEWQ